MRSIKQHDLSSLELFDGYANSSQTVSLFQLFWSWSFGETVLIKQQRYGNEGGFLAVLQELFESEQDKVFAQVTKGKSL